MPSRRRRSGPGDARSSRDERGAARSRHETQTAGLDACRAIRNDLNNHFVRILLRTVSPASHLNAPPSRSTTSRLPAEGRDHHEPLYAAVRTALKSYEELVELERHRSVLSMIHQSVLALHSYDSLEAILQHILSTAMSVAPSPLAILNLTTFEEGGAPREWLLHMAGDADGDQRVASVVRAVAAQKAEQGFVVPIQLHRNLGSGWIYVDRVVEDELSRSALELLASHAANALSGGRAVGAERARGSVLRFAHWLICALERPSPSRTAGRHPLPQAGEGTAGGVR